MESGTNKNNGVGPAVAQKAKISIITVVYNGVKYIEESIQSVLNQDYPNLEYIIIQTKEKSLGMILQKKYLSNQKQILTFTKPTQKHLKHLQHDQNIVY